MGIMRHVTRVSSRNVGKIHTLPSEVVKKENLL